MKSISPELLKRRIEALNKKHAVVMIGGKCCILNEVIDPDFGRPDITLSSPNDFKHRYLNDRVLIEGAKNMRSIADLWLQSFERRQYQGIGMFPGRDIPGFYNLFRGLAVKPKRGKWDLFRQHIYEVLCSSDEQADQWLMNWLALIVQSIMKGTYERTEVAVVLKGGRGSGKGTFARGYGSIFGPHFQHITNPSQFLGRFNQHLKDCLLLFADEAFWAGDKVGEGVLKALITEPTIRVEPKGKDSFEVRNHANLIIAGNNDWVVPAGLDERRFMVLEVNDSHLQDHDYFKALRQEMDKGAIAAMLYDLLQMDLAGANIRAVPQTRGLFDQKLLSADTVTKWWYARLQEGCQLPDDGLWTSYEETQKLFIHYCEYAKLFSRHPDDPASFSRKLRALCQHESAESPGITGPKRINIAGKRLNVLIFPSLAESRKRFEEAIKFPVQWGKDDE
ncbi:MAG: primase-helicase family protein [Syntrophobacteraceae bacterium]